MLKSHKSLVVETQEQQDTWLVTPTPGYVLKFKEVVRLSDSQKTKGFVNVCHCSQLPPPTDDIDEDELAGQIDKGDCSYRVPLSVGELDDIEDKDGKPCVKLDVLVNTVFFEKRLSPPGDDFFRHFLCMVICEAIEKKHNLAMNPNEAIRLTRKKIGDVGAMRIFKRPPVPIVEEIAKESTSSAPVPPVKESLFSSTQPKNVRIRVLGGKKLEINFSLEGVEPSVKSIKRLRVKLTSDRVLVLLDNHRSLFDFFVPIKFDRSAARCPPHIRMASLLAGKVAVVTGGASGLGRAVCKKFAEQGAKVVVVDLNKDAAQNIAGELGNGGHSAFACDVSKSDQVTALRDFVLNQHKEVSVVVNSAGITQDSTLLKMTEDKFDKVISVNLKGTHLITQAFARVAVEKNSPLAVVLLSSIIGKTGAFGQTNYAASKAGVIGFTKSAAKELARKGVRVNAILPGFIVTPMTEAVPPKVLADIAAGIPMGRLGDPTEIANAALFLASDLSSYVTGTTLEVCGGLHA